MPNQPPQNPNQMSKPTALIVIIVIIIILGIGGYFLFTQEQGTNTNNTNITTTNTNQAVNTNTTSNTNLVTNANTNTVTNTTANTNIDTSGWKTYENEEYGYTLKYPTNWTYEDIYLTEDPLGAFPTPIKYSVFYSPEKKYHLVLGIKKAEDNGSIYYRTGIGAGEITDGPDAKIDDEYVNTWELIYEGKVKEIFFYSVETGLTYVDIKGYEVSASFGSGDLDASEWQEMNLLNTNEIKEVKQILATIKLK